MEKYVIAKHDDGTVICVSDIHRVLLGMMKDLDAVLRKHNIPYWLVGGSALGAVRHGGFIPWDDDMDIGMLRKDYERFLKVALADLDDKYVFQCYETDDRFNPCVPAKLILKGTHIKEYNTIGYALTWCFNSLLEPVRYPRDSVFPLQYVKFEDTMLPIPRNPHIMLDVEVSKNHMSYPPLKEQRPKHIRDAEL